MTNNPGRTESHISLMHDCSHMDCSVVERLRATVGISLEWAEQMLDVLIRLDDDLLAFDATVKQQIYSLRPPENLASGGTENRTLGLEEIAHQAEEHIQHLRSGVRDVMMSMQQQDVIGQSIERAANALAKRAEVFGKVVEAHDNSYLHTNEIAEIHRAYRAEDDLHRAIGLDGEEYKAAA